MIWLVLFLVCWYLCEFVCLLLLLLYVTLVVYLFIVVVWCVVCLHGVVCVALACLFGWLGGCCFWLGGGALLVLKIGWFKIAILGGLIASCIWLIVLFGYCFWFCVFLVDYYVLVGLLCVPGGWVVVYDIWGNVWCVGMCYYVAVYFALFGGCLFVYFIVWLVYLVGCLCTSIDCLLLVDLV